MKIPLLHAVAEKIEQQHCISFQKPFQKTVILVSAALQIASHGYILDFLLRFFSGLLGREPAAPPSIITAPRRAANKNVFCAQINRKHRESDESRPCSGLKGTRFFFLVLQQMGSIWSFITSCAIKVSCYAPRVQICVSISCFTTL